MLDSCFSDANERKMQVTAGPNKLSDCAEKRGGNAENEAPAKPSKEVKRMTSRLIEQISSSFLLSPTLFEFELCMAFTVPNSQRSVSLCITQPFSVMFA